MTANEMKILEIVWNWGGEASLDTVARESRVSIDYARLLCESLAREHYMDFLHMKLCKIRSKGKIELIKRNIKGPSKITVNGDSLGFGKNKKGRLTVDY